MKLIYSGTTKGTEDKLIFEKNNARTLCVYTVNESLNNYTLIRHSEDEELHNNSVIYPLESFVIETGVTPTSEIQWEDIYLNPEKRTGFKYRELKTWKPDKGDLPSGGGTGEGNGDGEIIGLPISNKHVITSEFINCSYDGLSRTLVSDGGKFTCVIKPINNSYTFKNVDLFGITVFKTESPREFIIDFNAEATSEGKIRVTIPNVHDNLTITCVCNRVML